ncbi:hypothetical protein FRB95_004337 [Tulasnella sp. JGI-2019a]|nr:hypothetical protein FRB95_004337 [Tulasnella sp. JGI-2019a]
MMRTGVKREATSTWREASSHMQPDEIKAMLMRYFPYKPTNVASVHPKIRSSTLSDTARRKKGLKIRANPMSQWLALGYSRSKAREPIPQLKNWKQPVPVFPKLP